GWEAGGYHLRLQVLLAAEFASHDLAPEDRDRMIDVLNKCEANHVFLSTQLIETLAAYDQISPITTLEAIQDDIAQTLLAEDDRKAQEFARSIVGRMFEREDVLGPYSEAIETLPEADRLWLFTMAVQTPQGDIEHEWIIRRLADAIRHADDRVGQAVAREARAVCRDSLMPQCAVRAHLHALRGWARVARELPPPPDTAGDPVGQAWRCIDELIFGLYREEPDPGRATQLWDQLLAELAAPAVSILSDIRQAANSAPNDGVAMAHDRLLAAYPGQLQALLEWALAHRDEVASVQPRFMHQQVEQYIFHALGYLGTPSTAAMLRHYTLDTEVGEHAVDAIREIEGRTSG
ncbi:MAG: hypothetical protein ACRDQ5_15265, partial [Sciscionella sp.]